MDKTLFKREKDGCYWLLEKPWLSKKARWINVSQPDAKPHPFQQGDLENSKVYEAQRREDVEALAGLLRETLMHGWITPEGEFWGCSRTNHEKLLQTYFGIDKHDADRQGWIHLNDEMWRHPASLCDEMGRITDEQAEKLEEIGRSPEIEDYSYMDDSLRFTDVYPDGYPLLLLPGNLFRLYKSPTGKTPAVRLVNPVP